MVVIENYPYMHPRASYDPFYIGNPGVCPGHPLTTAGRNELLIYSAAYENKIYRDPVRVG